MLQPSPQHRSGPIRYLVAVGVTVAAVLVAKLAQPFVASSVTPPFILAVAIAALYGGFGPGLLALALSTFALSYWFFPPLQQGPPTDLARQAIFLVVGAAVAWLGGTLERQRRLAIGEARNNERLRQQAEAALRLQHEAETALRESEAELKDFFDNASTPLHWVGPDGTILRVNRAELNMLGYERDEYLGHHIAEFHADRPVIDDILGRLLAGEVITGYPARLRCKDGTLKDVLIDSSGYWVDGRFVHSRCFTREITLEKHAQEASARLAAIVSSSSDAIISKTLDGVVTSWNAAAERIFGYEASEMVGHSIFKLIPPELHSTERYILEQLRRGEAVAFSESERVRKDGSRIWISLSVSPVRDLSGTVIGAASIKRDITEHRLVAENLRETQRLQTVGQLAGGIAHEANNQMSVVLGGAQFLLRRTDLAPAARADVEFIRQAAERTAAITQQLLAFSRRQLQQLQDVDLNRVVDAMQPVLRRSLTESHELVIRPRLEDGLVRADPRQLEQVLLNLTLNARDAMPGGGRITIETCELTVAGEPRGGANGPRVGRYAALVVTDTGHGMDSKVLARVFEPFFTTKEVGQGTGLGLSVVHGIVNQTGGHIRAESEPGKGSTFTVAFPITSSGDAVEPHSAEIAVPVNHGRVAVVDEDDALVRGMAARGLVEAGYRVLEAEHGAAALELIRRHSGRVDIVISDIGMPEMDGYELLQRLRQERPDLPVLFMSGYADADTAAPLLRKPFAPEALVRKAEEVLRAAAR
jgi:PAS domain S-box-containing protein